MPFWVVARAEDAMDRYHNEMFFILDIVVWAPGIAYVSLSVNGIIYVSLGMHKPFFFFFFATAVC